MQQRDWNDHENRSVIQLVSDVSRELQDIVRKEIELARLEIGENISSLNSSIASLAIGGVILHSGFLVLLAAAVLGLNELLEQMWLSAVVIGALTIGIGAILLVEARSRLRGERLQPTRSQRSLRKDKQLISEHV